MSLQRTISPVDGRVLVERPLADEAEIAAALERARAAAAGWRDTPVEERVALLGRAIDHMVARRDELAAEITWQMGRPIAQSPGEIRGPGGARPLHAGGSTAGAGRSPARAQGGLHPLRPPRAAGAGVRHRPLELSLPHRGQQHRPGPRRRQRRAAQAFGADALVRRALPGGVRRGGPAAGRVPAPAS